jgi:RNA polymerase sigma-B factor
LPLSVLLDHALDGLEAGAAHHSASLDAPRDELDGDLRTLVDVLGEEDHRFELIDATVSIKAPASVLSDRDREVLALRFGEDLTQTQIAATVGVSQMQVSGSCAGRLHGWASWPAPKSDAARFRDRALG